MAHFYRTTLVAVAAASIAASGQAQLIAYEGFDYNPGLNVGGLNGGTGWTGAWQFTTGGTVPPTATTQAGSLPNGGITSGGSATATRGALSNLRREFTSTTGRVWAAVAVRYNEILSNSVIEFNLSATGTDGGAGKFEIRTDNAGNTTLKAFHDFPGGWTTTAFTPTVGTTYNFVMTYAASGAAPTAIYVNPTFGLANPSGFLAANEFTSGNWSAPNLGRFRAFYDRTAYDIDEIRIGSTFADVTPIPEPATMSILAIAAAGAALRRKRK